MSVKKLLLVSVGLLSLSMNAQALNCATDCTKDVACKYRYKISQCVANCPGFTPDVCSTKAQESSPVQTSQEPAIPTDVPSSLPLEGASETAKPQPLPRPRPMGKRFETPPTLTEETPESKQAPVRALPSPTKPTATKGATNEALLLAKAQIDMLQESQRIANECDHMAFETAVMGAENPEQFRQDRKDAEDLESSIEIFPTRMKSIFPINPNFCSETIDPKKMDHQSFVRSLKSQTQTTKTMLSDVLTKVLEWKELSKVESYRNKVSQDLRALSSFCSGPIIQLKQAILHRKSLNKDPAESKRKALFGKIAAKFKKDKTD